MINIVSSIKLTMSFLSFHLLFQLCRQTSSFRLAEIYPILDSDELPDLEPGDYYEKQMQQHTDLDYIIHICYDDDHEKKDVDFQWLCTFV